MSDDDLEGLFDPGGHRSPPVPSSARHGPGGSEPLAGDQLAREAAHPPAPDSSPTTLEDARSQRGVPEVRRPASRWTVPAIFAGAVLITGSLVYSISLASGRSERPLTDPEPGTYAARLPAPEPGAVLPEAAAAEQMPAAATLPPGPANAMAGSSRREQERQDLQAAARQRAEDAGRRYAERLRSPLLVSGSASAAETLGGDGAGGGPVRLAGLAVSRDPNSGFLARASVGGTDTAQATMLTNQSTLVAQGTLVPGVLETAINSDLPGMLRAVVSADVLSFDQAAILIPRGSRLIGQYRSGLAVGETRAFVVWTRLITPTGVSIELGSPGTDALGQAGISGRVDEHFFRRFGAALLLSIIGSAGQAAANAADKGGDDITIDAAGDASRVAEIALQNRVNIPPTIRVRQGTPIRIFVARDLDFSGTPGAGAANRARSGE